MVGRLPDHTCQLAHQSRLYETRCVNADGDSLLGAFNNAMIDRPGLTYGVDSALGPLSTVSVTANWTNWYTGGTGSFGNYVTSPDQPSWGTTEYVYTNSGWVTGSMGDWVILYDGTHCTIVRPSAGITVTW